MGDGIFDTFIKAPYVLGYYKERAVDEFRIINKVVSNKALRNEAWNIFINDFINRPAYYIGCRTVMSSFLKLFQAG